MSAFANAQDIARVYDVVCRKIPFRVMKQASTLRDGNVVIVGAIISAV